MTLQEIKPNQVINTKTREECERICRLLDNQGFKTLIGREYEIWIHENKFNSYGTDTCIDILQGGYGSTGYLISQGKEIIDSTLIQSKTEIIIERTKEPFTKVEDYPFLAYENKSGYRWEIKTLTSEEILERVNEDNIKLYTFETEETMNKWLAKEID